MLEYFVHLDVADAAADLVLAMAEIPEDVSRERVAIRRLPSTWRDFPAPPELASIGDDFVRRGENCLLIVPSALAPHDDNWLLNPAHGDYKRLSLLNAERLSYDSRMLTGRGRRRAKRSELLWPNGQQVPPRAMGLAEPIPLLGRDDRKWSCAV